MKDDELSPAITQAIEVASLVPSDGKTAIHQSEHFREVAEVLALVCLDRDQTLSWPVMAENLERDFGLKVTPGQVANFCRRYIMPHIYMPRSVVMQSIIEGRRDLDTMSRQLDISDLTIEALREARKAMGAIEKDKDGRPVKVGPTPADVASLARAAAAANMKADELLERWGFFPERAAKKSGVEVNVNVNAGQNAMSRLGGRIIDAEPVDADPQ